MVIAPLPPGATDTDLLDFDEGLWPTIPERTRRTTIAEDGTTAEIIPKRDCDSWLLTKIQNYLNNRRYEQPVCILENDSAQANDPWLSLGDIRLLTLGDEVYHPLICGDSDEVVLKSVKSSRSWLFVGTLTLWPGTVPATEIASASSAHLEQLAHCSQAIFVGAYDGEGYLLWTPA